MNSEYWYDKEIKQSPEPVKESINYWKDARIQKSADGVYYYIVSRCNTRCFNPGSGRWVVSTSDNNGAMVCCFRLSIDAETCFEKYKPKPTLGELPQGTKFEYDGGIVIKTSMTNLVVCVDIVSGQAYTLPNSYVPKLVK